MSVELFPRILYQSIEHSDWLARSLFCVSHQAPLTHRYAILAGPNHHHTDPYVPTDCNTRSSSGPSLLVASYYYVAYYVSLGCKPDCSVAEAQHQVAFGSARLVCSSRNVRGHQATH